MRTESADRERGGLNGKRFAIPAACAFAILVLVRWLPSHFKSGVNVDLSYQVALHDAFARHLRFGEDIIFTYGPFGFTYAGYDPRTFAVGLAVWVTVATGIVIGTHEIARTAFAETWQRAGFIIISALIVGIDVGLYTDSPFIFISFVLLCSHFTGARTGVVPLLAAAAGVAALSKFTFLIAACAVVLIITADDLIRRRMPWALATFASAIVACWTFARQPLRVLPSYLRNAGEVAVGYSDAMSLTLPWPGDAAFLILSGAAAVMLVMSQLAAEWSRIRTRALLLAAGTTAILFLSFKSGFVRQDGKDLIFAIVLTGVAIVGSRGDRRLLFSVVASLLLLAHDLEVRNQPRLAGAIARTAAKRIGEAVELTRRGPAGRAAERRERLRDLAKDLDHPPAGTTFDVYSWNCALPTALGLTPSWRPILQSYSSYTPRLLELNAQHLRDGDAPSTLLLDVSTIDGRFPLADDGPSWPEILARYSPAETNGTYLVLSPRPNPKAPEFEHVSTRLVVAGQRFSLPERGVIFARIGLEPSILGRLESFLLKGPEHWMVVTMSDGRSRRFRIVAGNARAGFLVSPFVATTEDFAKLYRDPSTLPSVTAIKIEASPFLEREIRVELLRLRY